MNLEIIKPFGPSIAKVKIPDNIVNEMNDYTDNIINNKSKSKELDFGTQLVGNVHQEFHLDVEFMKKIDWANFIANFFY